MLDELGDRMKAYEAHETGRRFMPLLPVYARIDGRCFSAFTRTFPRPYSEAFALAMLATTEYLVAETHARIGYTQSDEISLVWLQPRCHAELFFAGKVQKMTSVLASMATARFTRACLADPALAAAAEDHLPAFDCRVFQLPTQTEAANMFLWRERDATKNAINSVARCHFSHRDLQGRSGSEMQAMLFSRGVNFNDCPDWFKRGRFVRRTVVERLLTADELDRIPEPHRPPADKPVTRALVQEVPMPSFSRVLNREQVIFDGLAPLLPADVV